MTAAPAFATNTLREIGTQPQMWRQAIAQSQAGTALPPAGTPVLFLGCGTSYYIGLAYAKLRNELDLGRTRAAVPSELDRVEPDETVVVLSRSGTTGDVLAAASQLRERHRVVGIIGEPGTPLVSLCHDVVLLDYADEVSVVQTRFATTAFMLLRASLTTTDVNDLPAQAERALERSVPSPVPAHVVFLGTGFSLGLAHEAALKCLESSGRWVEAYAVREYQHGPISAAGPGTLVWPLVPLPDSVSAGVLETGATLVTPELDPQAELVAVHLLAVAMARDAGRDPDVPPFLSRAVENA